MYTKRIEQRAASRKTKIDVSEKIIELRLTFRETIVLDLCAGALKLAIRSHYPLIAN